MLLSIRFERILEGLCDLKMKKPVWLAFSEYIPRNRDK
jgi:hypothetical protein